MEINIRVSEDELNVIITALAQRPYFEVAQLLAKIARQGEQTKEVK